MIQVLNSKSKHSYRFTVNAAYVSGSAAMLEGCAGLMIAGLGEGG